MILYLDTVTDTKKIKVAILKDSFVLAKKNILAYKNQAEKLLPLIDKILKDNELKLSDIKKIKVNNRGGSFTSLRIGVVTANALAFALNIPVEGEYGEGSDFKKNKLNIAIAEYNLDPNITIKKKNIY